MAREEASSLLTESRLADQHAAVPTKAGMTATRMAGFPVSAQLKTLSPPSDDGKGSLRPPTLRTRSTGGLMLTRENEFYAVESPSPVLSPQHFGLDGLSESLAHLMKQRRHSHTGEEERPKEKEYARAFTKAFTSDHRETSEGLLAAGIHASAPHDADTAPTSSASSSRPISPSPQHISTPHSGPSTTRTSLYSSQKLSPPQMSDYVSKQSSKATSSTTAASVTATRNNSQHQSTPWPTALGMLRKASADEQQTFSAESSRAQSPFDSGSTTPRTRLQVAGGGKSKPQVLETHRLQLQTHAATGRRMINQYIIETELGRGVHGKVRLARDTETGERVAVKIVEREGKKRLGGGLGWNAKFARDDSDSMRDSKEALDGAKADAISREEGGSTNDRPTSPKARFADESSKASQPSPSSEPLNPNTAGSSLAARMWGAGKAAHFSSADREAEEQRAQREKRQEARKRQLWTTDKKVKREIALLKKCAHENVVQLKEVIDDPSSKKIFMVLEFMEGGEVQWKDERGFPTLTVDEARRTLRDVVLGLEYLHYQGIIHRDIKPANLLWDANHKVKISDFGVSHFSYALLVASGGLPSLDGDEERMKDPSLVDDHELAKTAGSPAFFAPELCLAGEPMQTGNSQASARTRAAARHEDPNEFPWLKKDPSSSTREASADSTKAFRRNRPPITKAIDVWALGVTLYCLLFGHVPFTADSEFALFTIIPREDYALPAFMGADRIRIGPRKKRWTTLPQWQDEEADVDQESQDGKESDVDPSLLSEEARLVRDLLDQLLEKDPSKRIKLEDAKKHPWLMRDIANPPQWLCETDPAQLPSVEVSNEEVDGALTGFSKIKQTLKRFQTKLFAGLAGQGQHLPSSDDRADYGQQHRKSHIVSGVTIRRQRSKSTSHAQDQAPILQSTGHSKTGGHARLQALAPIPSTTMSSATPKSQASSNRPHLFFKRRPSVPSVGTVSTAGVVEGVARVTSRSQPGSRPQSPAVTELSAAEKGVRSKGSDKEILPLERGRKTPNRQSSFFKRTASRVEPRESTSSLQNAYTSDRFSSSKGLPDQASDVSSLPLSRTGSDKTARDRNATHPSSAGDLTLPRSSLDSEAGQWSLVSASQNGSIAPTPLSTQRPQAGRPRSRSRLSDVFRNVLGHQAHTDARNGGSGSKSRNHQDGTVEASTPAAVSQTSAAREPGEEAEEEEQSCLEGVVTAAAAATTEPVARSIDVDDYDVDLDLSDDDLDDDRIRSHNNFLRNDGRGWRMERNATSSSASHAEQHRPNSATSDSLTPSVEGGYNLFKAPYLGFVQDPAKVTDDTESYAMTGFHSDEAEALRRASAKVGDDCGHRHGEVAWAADAEGMGNIVDPLTMGNVSTMTEDRFADADEEDSGVVSHVDEDFAADEEDDDDDGGVSFQARKRGNS